MCHSPLVLSSAHTIRTQACMRVRRRLDRTDFQNHPDVRLLIFYSEALSHLIYAAADVVLVSSGVKSCICAGLRLLYASPVLQQQQQSRQ